MIENYSIEITSQAYDDLAEIMDWYFDQREGLEQEFFLSFEAALKRLERNPLAYQTNYKKTRSIFLQRFPYKVFFQVYEKTIKIYAVYHHSRNPKFIHKRLK